MNETGEHMRAWSHLLGAHALAMREIERQLGEAGLPSMAWYDVLWELERAGGRLRIGELANRLVVERYNMTRLIDRLEKEGLLRREPDSEDRRASLVVLTDAGAAMRQRMWPHYRAAVEAAFAAALDEGEAAALTETLKKVIGRLKA